MDPDAQAARRTPSPLPPPPTHRRRCSCKCCTFPSPAGSGRPASSSSPRRRGRRSPGTGWLPGPSCGSRPRRSCTCWARGRGRGGRRDSVNVGRWGLYQETTGPAGARGGAWGVREPPVWARCCEHVRSGRTRALHASQSTVASFALASSASAFLSFGIKQHLCVLGGTDPCPLRAVAKLRVSLSPFRI